MCCCLFVVYLEFLHFVCGCAQQANGRCQTRQAAFLLITLHRHDICVLTEPFSMTRLSMMTAFVFCSQTMSQKWPQVFLRGPCRQQTHTHANTLRSVTWQESSRRVGSHLHWEYISQAGTKTSDPLNTSAKQLGDDCLH